MFLLLASYSAIAQNKVIDSLKRQEVLEEDSKRKVDIWNALSMALYDYDGTAANRYAVKALGLSEQIRYMDGKKNAYLLTGVWFIATGELLKAMDHYRKSLAIKGTEELNGYGFNLMGNAFRLSGQLDSATYYYQKSIALLESVNNKFYLSITYKNMGRALSSRWQMDEAYSYLQKSLKLRLELKDTLGIADNYNSLATLFLNQGDIEKAEDWVQKSCALVNGATSPNSMIQCHYFRADIYFRKGDNTLALIELRKALSLLENSTYQEYKVNVLIKLGEIYDGLGQGDLGLDALFKALKLAETIGLRPEEAAIYGHIAWFYKNQNDFETALEYLQKSLKLYSQMNDRNGLSFVFNIKGLTQFQLAQYDSAIYYLNESFMMRKALNNISGIASSGFNLALVYEELKEYDQALALQTESLQMEEKMRNHSGLGISYNAIAAIYLKKNDLTQAERYIKLAEYEGNYTQSKLIRRNTLELYSKLFEKRGDFKKSLDYHKRFHEINDSLYTESSADKAAELRSLYQLDKQQQEITLLNKQKELQQQEIQQQRTVIFSALAGVVLLVLAGFIGYHYYRIKSRTNRELEKLNREIREQKEEIQSQSEELIEANQIVASVNRTLKIKIEERTSELKQAYKELDTFFYRSSHDFRRPLTTFLGLAEVAKVTVKDSNALELFDKVRETAVNLDRMLVKLQSISDLGTQQMVFKEVFIKELTEQVIESFRHEVGTRYIQFKIQVGGKVPFYSYPVLIKLILENLIENSIQFSSPEQAVISINAESEEKGLHLTIEDNGIGILQEYHDRVFDMYFRANEKSKGNGLGLYIVKKVVQKLDGQITLISEYQQGSKFEIFIPNMALA